MGKQQIEIVVKEEPQGGGCCCGGCSGSGCGCFSMAFIIFFIVLLL